MTEITREQIENMPAGYKINKLISQYVFSLKTVKNWSDNDCKALEIVHFVKDKTYKNPRQNSIYTTPRYVEMEYWQGDWMVKIHGPIPSVNGGMGIGHAETLALAICRAVLLAFLGL